jgi:ABC-type amino acid transport system permease subunit
MLAANFDWQFIWDHLPDFWEGLKQTLKVAAIGIAGSLLIGIVLGAARAHRVPVVSWLAAV